MKQLFLSFAPFFLLCSVLFSSCEKILMEPDIAPTPTNTFNYLWQKIDEGYSHFDVKQIDWDSIYRVLSPKVSDDITDDSLFSILSQMINALQDGHANVWYSFDASQSEEIYHNMYTHYNIDIPTIALHYLRPDHHTAGGFQYNSIHDGKFVYIRYSSFSNSAATAYLTNIIKRYPNALGLILDVRQNGGGNIDNEWNILKILPNHGQHLYDTQIKSGKDHNDFTPYTSLYAPDTNEDLVYTNPIVLLTDRGSYSATSYFALCMKSYPNVLQMGDTTGGGLGLPNGGQLPNGWYYRFSVTRTLSPQGDNFENGVPPDEVVFLSSDSAALGIDNVIERACLRIEQMQTKKHYQNL